MELPPSWFVKSSAIWGECLNYRGEPGWGSVESVGEGDQKKIFPPRKNRETVNSLLLSEFFEVSVVNII